MDKEMQRKQAVKIFETVCSMFDDMDWHYEKKDDFVLSCTIGGDDIPMDMLVIVRPEQQIVSIISPIPVVVPEEKVPDISMAVNVVNNGLINGCFDYDIAEGRIVFRIVESYVDSILGKELFKHLIMVSSAIVDEYNDKFFMMAKGMLSFEDFMTK